MALNRSDKSRILRRYFPGMTRNSEMSTEPSRLPGQSVGAVAVSEDHLSITAALVSQVYGDFP